MNTIHTIHEGRLHLGEAPIWDERLRHLFYVDILKKTLYSWDYHTKDRTSYFFSEYISCIALTENKDILWIALESGIYSFHLGRQEKVFICQPETEQNYRYNDGAVDWNGNWLIGSMNNINNGPDATHLPDANLYQVHGMNSRRLLTDVTISNGIAFQFPYMYYIDSKCNNIRKFLYDHNKLSLVEEVFSISDGTTLDGMTISKSNKLYIANWGGGQILVFDLLQEKIIDNIAVPALNPASCTFGGPMMNELFITTSDIDDENPSLAGVYSIILDDYGMEENKIVK